MTAAEKAREIADDIIGKSFYRGEQSEARLIGAIETALLEAKREAYEDAAQAMRRQGDSYHSQMEGKGEPEFSRLDFAIGACHHMEKVFRAKKGELK